MTTEIGFKFKPTFPSNIDHFEVRGYDDEKGEVLTTVYPKNGHTFNDSIDRMHYDVAFEIGEYVPL